MPERIVIDKLLKFSWKLIIVSLQLLIKVSLQLLINRVAVDCGLFSQFSLEFDC